VNVAGVFYHEIESKTVSGLEIQDLDLLALGITERRYLNELSRRVVNDNSPLEIPMMEFLPLTEGGPVVETSEQKLKETIDLEDEEAIDLDDEEAIDLDDEEAIELEDEDSELDETATPPKFIYKGYENNLDLPDLDTRLNFILGFSY